VTSRSSQNARILGAALAVALLTACGGGGGGSGTLPPQGLNRQTQSGGPQTLYVSSTASVYAYNTTDSGTTSPSRTITTAGTGHTNVGIAAYTDGTLDILQAVTGTYAPCRVVAVAANANGSAVTPIGKTRCSNDSTIVGIATNLREGGVDIVGATSSNNYFLYRATQPSDGSGALGTVGNPDPLGNPGGLTVNFAGGDPGDPGGHIYINTSDGTVYKFRANNTDGNQVVQFSTPSGSAGAMTVSPIDQTLYVVEPGAGASNTFRIVGFLPATYHASSNPAADYSLDLGSNVTAVPALQCDSSGNLYVALVNSSGSHVRVYSPHFSPSGILRALDLPATPVALAIH